MNKKEGHELSYEFFLLKISSNFCVQLLILQNRIYIFESRILRNFHH